MVTMHDCEINRNGTKIAWVTLFAETHLDRAGRELNDETKRERQRESRRNVFYFYREEGYITFDTKKVVLDAIGRSYNHI